MFFCFCCLCFCFFFAFAAFAFAFAAFDFAFAFGFAAFDFAFAALAFFARAFVTSAAFCSFTAFVLYFVYHFVPTSISQ